MQFLSKAIVLLVIAGFVPKVHAQTVKLLSVEQLEARLNNGKDTTYVINLWATWCAPCLKEIPQFEKFGVDFADRKLKVLLVSIDKPSKLKSSVIPVIRRLKLKSEVLLINETDQEKYKTRIDSGWSGALPASLFINKAKDTRKFMEREFTYSELVKIYHSI